MCRCPGHVFKGVVLCVFLHEYLLPVKDQALGHIGMVPPQVKLVGRPDSELFLQWLPREVCNSECVSAMGLLGQK